MEPVLQDFLNVLYSLIVREQVVFIIFQTLLYGIYLCLVPIAVHVLVTNGLQSRARKWLLAITASMFVLMTVYWILSVVFTFIQIDTWDNMVTACYDSDNALLLCIADEDNTIPIPTAPWLGMFISILFVDYIVADGVLVWRAWVLCSEQSRVVLMIPVVTLGVNTAIYLMTIAARAIALLLASKREDNRIPLTVYRIIDIGELAQLTLSLLTNMFATSIIALKAWKYRKLLIESGIGVRTPRQAFRMLAILVESGIIYILIRVTSVVSIFILISRSGIAQIPQLFLLAGIQLAEIYPIVVILLVEKNRSLNSVYISFGTIIDVRGDRPSDAEPTAFASGSVLASGGKTDPVGKPPHSTTHVTFDHMLEPGGAGIGAGNGKASNEEHAASY